MRVLKNQCKDFCAVFRTRKTFDRSRTKDQKDESLRFYPIKLKKPSPSVFSRQRRVSTLFRGEEVEPLFLPHGGGVESAAVRSAVFTAVAGYRTDSLRGSNRVIFSEDVYSLSLKEVLEPIDYLAEEIGYLLEEGFALFGFLFAAVLAGAVFAVVVTRCGDFGLFFKNRFADRAL